MTDSVPEGDRLTNAELVRQALLFWRNHIETGNMAMSAADLIAAGWGEKVKRLRYEQRVLVKRLELLAEGYSTTFQPTLQQVGGVWQAQLGPAAVGLVGYGETPRLALRALRCMFDGAKSPGNPQEAPDLLLCPTCRSAPRFVRVRGPGIRWGVECSGCHKATHPNSATPTAAAIVWNECAAKERQEAATPDPDSSVTSPTPQPPEAGHSHG